MNEDHGPWESGRGHWAWLGDPGVLELPCWALGWDEAETQPSPGEVILVVANKPLWKM